ncbi:MAG: hypothetical protein OEZ39_20285 [Gammaproteobacteria bacterium]|nr:hypothetical protein [Gammaproteobacteria bacterium]
MKKGLAAPSLQTQRRYRVNRRGQFETVYQPLYDFTTYAAAGQTSLTFFQTPIGQSGKTYADTNMESAGQLPSPKSMMVTAISVVFFPGSAVNATGALTTTGVNWEDVNTVHKSGFLKLFCGSKDFIIDGPIGKFPPPFRLTGAAAMADASTAAADLHSQIDYASMTGITYQIVPITIPPNQNFNVTLNWPTAVALPSTVAGRIGIILDGFLTRLSQ